jgi:hypothetical protein
MKRLFALFTVSFCLVGCKKEPTKIYDRFDSIVGDWHWKSQIIETGSVDTAYNYGDKECEKDNVWHFDNDSSYYADSGPLKCDSSQKQITEYGVWSLVDNQTKLRFKVYKDSALQLSRDWNIVTADSNSIILHSNFDYMGPNGNIHHSSIWSFERF